MACEGDIKMTEKEAIRKLLDWLVGFEESELYQDYKQAEGFTDNEWDAIMIVLYKFANESMLSAKAEWHYEKIAREQKEEY